MAAEFRVGIVGCGLAARDLHIPALQRLPGVEVVGVCDLDAERARGLASQFGVAGSHASLDELLQAGSPNVVHVLTRPESHMELSIRALEAGCHVLIEKPFVYTVEEAERVTEAAERAGRRFSVIHNELFVPPVDELRARLAAKEIGTLTSVQYLSSRRRQVFVPDVWYYRTCGGRMGETLPHALCLLEVLLGDLEVLHVDARQLGFSITPDFVAAEDVGIDELRVQLWSGASNAGGSIAYGFNSDVPTCVLACGTKGNLLVYPFGGVTTLSTEGPRLSEELPNVAKRVAGKVARRAGLGRRSEPGMVVSGHFRQIESFYEDLRSGEEFGVSPHQAREVVRLWQQITSHY